MISVHWCSQQNLIVFLFSFWIARNQFYQGLARSDTLNMNNQQTFCGWVSSGLVLYSPTLKGQQLSSGSSQWKGWGLCWECWECWECPRYTLPTGACDLQEAPRLTTWRDERRWSMTSCFLRCIRKSCHNLGGVSHYFPAQRETFCWGNEGFQMISF